MKKSIFYIAFALLTLALSTSCLKHTPKPKGYFRIDLKEKEYSRSDSTLPYSFEYPKNLSLIVPNKQDKEWFDIVYPRYNARIYFSYKPVNKNFREISEDSRNFVYKHAFKADAIGEQFFENTENKTYGILYEIKGNTASAVQFVLTDSVNHFLRGALYFNNRPNKDSIAPVVDYITEDIVKIMETTRWN